ncbi:hypothetical protein GUITHDRAFT_120597 [Guillardia theta CCMP2712]|uniref:Uncharacterized protein n=1 Tax=Guillardia theta (strain CCMP2712) TaxID=905079 RepID=L1IAE1_GUITC|nr:hypothetical protein GUITHDRAFT_120597 [Guillardia theta CCMP2712]EKX33231.1 hypothetical protein GUITHDRAFT_120597 [Guillardia theta CCMP2712]|mmetsp:Transcript_29316/g.94136  ORF Transcript_29316/g.94136 Transcript_29316/m.94136 type:complete len:173 (-) Transcript_29316:96-614(-)|eukprot:XP_005820211.1 hypothetical protein GUITHDRAFT_120597 [Guillardia theta CCMP2712]
MSSITATMEQQASLNKFANDIVVETQQHDCYLKDTPRMEEEEVDVDYPRHSVPFENCNLEFAMPPPRRYMRSESSSSLKCLLSKERDFTSREWRKGMMRSSSERCLSSSGSFVRSRNKCFQLPSWQEAEIRKKHNMSVGMELSQSDEAKLPARMMLLDLRRSNSEPCLVSLD